MGDDYGDESGFGDYGGGGGAEFSEEVGEEGPCGKICGAFGAMCLGLFLFPLSLFLLGWNEQNFVCTDKQIIYSSEKAKSVECNANLVDPDTFAFFSCPFVQSSLQTYKPCMFNVDHGMSCAGGFGDAFSFVSVSAAQKAEMYQCVESCSTQKQKKNGQNVNVKTCTYSNKWEANHIDSNAFERQDIAQSGCPGYNPSTGNPSFPTNIDPGQGDTDYAPAPVMVGDPKASFTLSNDLVKQLSPSTPVPLAGIPHNISGTAISQIQPPNFITKENVVVSGNYIVSCPSTARVGCIRLSYVSNTATSPSVLGKVSESGMVGPERVPGSWLCSSGDYDAIAEAPMTMDEMIKHLKAQNQTTVWVIRIIGILLAWISVFCIFSPCAAFADLVGDIANFVPCCGGYIEDMIEGVANAIICILACGIGCSCSLFVIATVWVAMRPMFGIPLMIGACCICGGGIAAYTMLKDNGRKQKNRAFDPEEGGSE